MKKHTKTRGLEWCRVHAPNNTLYAISQAKLQMHASMWLGCCTDRFRT